MHDKYTVIEELRGWEIAATTDGNVQEAKAYRRMIAYLERQVPNQRPHVSYKV